MASSHLAQLVFNKEVKGTDSYHSWSYGCRNFNEVIFEIDVTAEGSAGDVKGSDLFISIFAGSDSVVNRIPVDVLASMCQYEAGTGFSDDTSSASKDEWIFKVDTGLYQLEQGDELIVKFDGGGLKADDSEKVNVTVHANVNAVESPSPKVYQYRTDGSFKVDHCEQIYCFKDGMDELSTTTEISYGSETISQYFSGLNAKINVNTIGDAKISNMGCVYDGLARDIVVNTTEAGVSYVCVMDKPVEDNKLALNFSWIRNRLSQITPKEKLAFKNKG